MKQTQWGAWRMLRGMGDILPTSQSMFKQAPNETQAKEKAYNLGMLGKFGTYAEYLANKGSNPYIV